MILMGLFATLMEYPPVLHVQKKPKWKRGDYHDVDFTEKEISTIKYHVALANRHGGSWAIALDGRDYANGHEIRIVSRNLPIEIDVAKFKDAPDDEVHKFLFMIGDKKQAAASFAILINRLVYSMHEASKASPAQQLAYKCK